MDIRIGRHIIPAQRIVENARSHQLIKTKRLNEDSFEEIRNALSVSKPVESVTAAIHQGEEFDFFSDQFRRRGRLMPIMGRGVLMLNPFNQGGALFSGRICSPGSNRLQGGYRQNYLYPEEVVSILLHDEEKGDLDVLARTSGAILIADKVFSLRPATELEVVEDSAYALLGGTVKQNHWHRVVSYE